MTFCESLILPQCIDFALFAAANAQGPILPPMPSYFCTGRHRLVSLTPEAAPPAPSPPITCPQQDQSACAECAADMPVTAPPPPIPTPETNATADVGGVVHAPPPPPPPQPHPCQPPLRRNFHGKTTMHGYDEAGMQALVGMLHTSVHRRVRNLRDSFMRPAYHVAKCTDDNRTTYMPGASTRTEALHMLSKVIHGNMGPTTSVESWSSSTTTTAHSLQKETQTQ